MAESLSQRTLCIDVGVYERSTMDALAKRVVNGGGGAFPATTVWLRQSERMPVELRRTTLARRDVLSLPSASQIVVPARRSGAGHDRALLQSVTTTLGRGTFGHVLTGNFAEMDANGKPSPGERVQLAVKVQRAGHVPGDGSTCHSSGSGKAVLFEHTEPRKRYAALTLLLELEAHHLLLQRRQRDDGSRGEDHEQLQLQLRQADLFQDVKALHVFQDGLLMVQGPLCGHGDLQSVVSAIAYASTTQVPEAWIAWVTVQLLAAIHEVHRAGLVHADVKPDNIGLCTVATEQELWERLQLTGLSLEDRDLAAPMPCGAISVLDFGKVKVFDDQTTRVGETSTFVSFRGQTTHDTYASAAMLQGKPWNVGADAFALCQVVYQLLSRGERLSRDGPRGSHGVVRAPRVRRYWQFPDWAEFFAVWLRETCVGEQEALEAWLHTLRTQQSRLAQFCAESWDAVEEQAMQVAAGVLELKRVEQARAL